MATRIVGYFFLAASLWVLGYDLMSSWRLGELHFTSLGGYWFAFHSDSLNLAQAVVQRYLWPSLWDPVITWILLRPAWVAAIVLSALFLTKGFRAWGGRAGRKSTRPKHRHRKKDDDIVFGRMIN